MIVKIFHEYVNQSTTKNVKEDLQKLEDKINMFAGEKGVLIHDIKYETLQKDQIQQLIIAFVHHTAVNEETGQVEKDDIPKVVVEKK
jgi:phosphoribosylaminoimidazole-succinocarboxamide synthase